VKLDIDNHIRYLDGFIDALGLDRITIVCHDWGSFFGFHYACRHSERIKGLAFMEAMLLIHADPGLLIPAPAVDWYRQQLPNLETAFVGSGLHYIQEDQPQKTASSLLKK